MPNKWKNAILEQLSRTQLEVLPNKSPAEILDDIIDWHLSKLRKENAVVFSAPPGFHLMPGELTHKMHRAFEDARFGSQICNIAYKAMIEVSPKAMKDLKNEHYY